jgi:hypothetical protein
VTLPDWLIVGTPKSGTTTLAAWLREHPQVCLATVKEVDYFDRWWERGPQWYADQFPRHAPGQKCGEATPTYAYSVDALDRIAATSPTVRLVLMLREPVGRLWSHSAFLQMLGSDPRPLERALRDEQRRPDRLKWGLTHGYLESSRYAPLLRALLDRFSRDQVLVLFFDHLIEEPLQVWRETCRHIGVDPESAVPSDLGSANPTTLPRSVWLQVAMARVARSRSWQALPGATPERMLRRLHVANARGPRPPPPPEELRRRLRAEFAPDLREVATLLQRPLPAGWLDPAD